MSRSAQEVGPFDPAGLPGVGPLFEQWGTLRPHCLPSFQSGKGLCCSFASVQDVDWETKDGRYRVRL